MPFCNCRCASKCSTWKSTIRRTSTISTSYVKLATPGVQPHQSENSPFHSPTPDNRTIPGTASTPFMTTLNPEAYLSHITTRLTTPCKKTPCSRPPPEYGLKQGIFLQPNNNQPITKHHPAPGFRLFPPRMTSSRCRKGNAGSAVIQTAAGNQFPESGETRTARTCLAFILLL